MAEMYLPTTLAWVGFDAEGKAVAASIERAKPVLAKTARGVFYGCQTIRLCRVLDDKGSFGRHMREFQVFDSLAAEKHALKAPEARDV